MATFSRSAEVRWTGDVMRGSGEAVAASGAFTVPVRFPSTLGEPPGKTTPEELLAASHATCFGIGLRSVIGRRGGSASRVVVSATGHGREGLHWDTDTLLPSPRHGRRAGGHRRNRFAGHRTRSGRRLHDLGRDTWHCRDHAHDPSGSAGRPVGRQRVSPGKHHFWTSRYFGNHGNSC